MEKSEKQKKFQALQEYAESIKPLLKQYTPDPDAAVISSKAKIDGGENFAELLKYARRIQTDLDRYRPSRRGREVKPAEPQRRRWILGWD